MRSLVELAIFVACVTLSNALAPGPLTAATIATANIRGWRNGIAIAFGHTLFEVPYLVLLLYAYSHLEKVLQLKPLRLVIGSVALQL